ncbi:helix-turn-helix domain-containing protein [Kitasatospora sp. HPMI-4]|uniref:helix-turn-helix domain-containing protein n=1 Tax=Kitasatospora sp. HPMI-4 TaxID=3448443 RepID=UPI003F1D8B88
MSMDWVRLGVAIRDARDAIGWTQQELANRSQVSVATIRQLEGGKQRTRHSLAADRVGSALGWTPESVKAVLDGGKPTTGAAAEAPAEPGASADALAGLSLRIRRELAAGQVLDGAVLDLPAAGRLSVVMIPLVPEDASEDEIQAALEEWKRLHLQRNNEQPNV